MESDELAKSTRSPFRCASAVERSLDTQSIDNRRVQAANADRPWTLAGTMSRRRRAHTREGNELMVKERAVIRRRHSSMKRVIMNDGKDVLPYLLAFICNYETVHRQRTIQCTPLLTSTMMSEELTMSSSSGRSSCGSRSTFADTLSQRTWIVVEKRTFPVWGSASGCRRSSSASNR